MNNKNTTEVACEKLSPRQKECLYWIAQGKTIEETAMILKIKYGTVIGYVRTLKEKLKCSTLSHLVYKAMKSGIDFSEKGNSPKVGE